MQGIVLFVEFAVCLLTAAILLRHYGDLKRQNRLSTLLTFLSWYLSFLLLFLLPVDIASTLYRRCLNHLPNATSTNDSTATPMRAVDASFIATASARPSIGVGVHFSEDALHSYRDGNNDTGLVGACVKPWMVIDDHLLQSLWRFIYWSTQLLTWIALPLMQSYTNAGDFSAIGKLRSAVIQNAIYYGTYLLVFCVLLIYVTSKVGFSFSQLKVICITASNTWGLFLLVMLLGYGLVEVPRCIWNGCNHSLALAKTYFKISKLSSEKSESEEELEDCLERVKGASQAITYSHPSRVFLDVILEKCPDSIKGTVRPCALEDYQDYREDGTSRVISAETSEKYLVRLHSQLIRSLQAYHRTQAQWERIVARALDLEDEVANLGNADRKFLRSALTAESSPTVGSSPGLFSRLYSPSVEWHWRCLLRPGLLRILAGVCAVFSVLVVWSEVTFFNTSPVLSVFAVAVKSAFDHTHYSTAVFICGCTVSYLSLVAYYTVFRIRIFNYYYIAGDHLTDENSLLFIGTLLSRLTPPLCLNFLGLILLDRDASNNEDETSFTKIMGRLRLIPFIAGGFNVYFPILILLLCLTTYFSLGSRCLQFLGIHQFIGDDEMTQDFIDEGHVLLEREKRLRERQVSGCGARRRYRYGAYRKVDRTETEGTELRSGRISAGGMREPTQSSKTLNKPYPTNYGAAKGNDRAPLLDAEVT